MNSWFIIILLGFIICVYYVMNYKQYYEKFDVQEFSCKFSKNSNYNDSRFIKMFYTNLNEAKKEIFDKYGINSELVNFYFEIKNQIGFKNIKGIVIGFDKQKSIEKIYIDTNRTIIGMEIDLNNQKKKFRKYLGTEFNKIDLDNFIGKENSDTIYNILNFFSDDSKLPMIFNKHIGDLKESVNMENVVSKHICFLDFNKKIYISDLKEELIQIINLFGCNSNGLDNWLKENKNKQIAWIGLTKVEDNNIDVTIYYRD